MQVVLQKRSSRGYLMGFADLNLDGVHELYVMYKFNGGFYEVNGMARCARCTSNDRSVVSEQGSEQCRTGNGVRRDRTCCWSSDVDTGAYACERVFALFYLSACKKTQSHIAVLQVVCVPGLVTSASLSPFLKGTGQESTDVWG